MTITVKPVGAPAPYDGPVETPFLSSDQEILNDLLAVIRAASQKPINLTKAQIPPKPLWTAINRLLLWKDPVSILYDWEEIDQVRFTYRLAEGLDLMRPDEAMVLHVGPGADQFFMASAIERAGLLRRAYFNLYDWDERCDARDSQGHRYNFGQAFRRDFTHDVMGFREITWDLLEVLPENAWVTTSSMARALTKSCPDLLLSEVCDLPEVGVDGCDPEILRFVNYWGSLLSRFGWMDLARSGADGDDARLCRLTRLGWALVHQLPFDEETKPSIRMDDRLILELDPEHCDVSARYVAWRLSQSDDFAAHEAAAVFRLTRLTLQKALQQEVDLESAIHWLEQRSESGIPPRLTGWIQELLASRRSVGIVQNAVVLDLNGVQPEDRQPLIEKGFVPCEDLILAAGTEVPALFLALSGEPESGFDYPPEEPYAHWKPGPTLELVYSELPLIHRGLLVELGVSGDPLSVTLTEQNVARIVSQGWTAQKLQEALDTLTLKPATARLKKQIEDLFATAGSSAGN